MKSNNKGILTDLTLSAGEARTTLALVEADAAPAVLTLELALRCGHTAGNGSDSHTGRQVCSKYTSNSTHVSNTSDSHTGSHVAVSIKFNTCRTRVPITRFSEVCSIKFNTRVEHV